MIQYNHNGLKKAIPEDKSLYEKLKGNNGKGDCIERDSWQTPKDIWNKLNNQYKFEFDCCASKLNTKCPQWFSISNPFFNTTKDFIDYTICWMNPPFSKSKEMFNHFFKVVSKGIAIYRCDNMETKIWQEIILPNINWVFIPKGRISYEGKVGKGSRFPSALIGVGLPPPINLKGKLLTIIKN